MADGRIVAAVAMVSQAGTFRDDGATSVEAWLAERFGLSVATARSYCHVAEQVARPAPSGGVFVCGRDLLRQGAGRGRRGHAPDRSGACAPRPRSSVSVNWPRWPAPRAARARAASVSPSRSEHDASLPALQRRAPHRVDAAAGRGLCPDQGLCGRLGEGSLSAEGSETLSNEDKVPLDQRRCDGFLAMVDSATPGRHPGSASGSANEGRSRPQPVLGGGPCAPRRTWSRDQVEPGELAAELEHGGLIDLETVRRIACDATVVVAVDDDVGPHHVRGAGQALPDRGPATRGDPPGPSVPVLGLCERDLRGRAPRRALEPRWRDRPRQSGPSLQTPPRGGAPQRLVHDGEPQSGAADRESRGPGHALAPFGALDQGDGGAGADSGG